MSGYEAGSFADDVESGADHYHQIQANIEPKKAFFDTPVSSH